MSSYPFLPWSEAAVPYLPPHESLSRIPSPLSSDSSKPIVSGRRENNGISMGYVLITIWKVAVSVCPPLPTLHRDSEEYDITFATTCIETFFTPSINYGRVVFCPLSQPGRQWTPVIPLLSTLTLLPISVCRMKCQGLDWTALQTPEDIIQGEMCTHPTEDAPDRCLCDFPNPPISWWGSTGTLYRYLWRRKLHPCNIMAPAIRTAGLIGQGFRYAV